MHGGGLSQKPLNSQSGDHFLWKSWGSLLTWEQSRSTFTCPAGVWRKPEKGMLSHYQLCAQFPWQQLYFSQGLENPRSSQAGLKRKKTQQVLGLSKNKDLVYLGGSHLPIHSSCRMAYLALLWQESTARSLAARSFPLCTPVTDAPAVPAHD